jgi:hypothetical protein
MQPAHRYDERAEHLSTGRCVTPDCWATGTVGRQGQARESEFRQQLAAPRTVQRQAAPGTLTRKPEAEPDPQPGAGRTALASDPELRQLASDLARLRAQAEAVSEDPVGFRQRAERALAQRDRCQDAACLRAWHAKRRRELLAEF